MRKDEMEVLIDILGWIVICFIMFAIGVLIEPVLWAIEKKLRR